MKRQQKPTHFTVYESATGNVFVKNPDYRWKAALSKTETPNKHQEFLVYYYNDTDNLTLALKDLVKDCLFLQEHQNWHHHATIWEEIKPVFAIANTLNWHKNQKAIQQAKEELAIRIYTYQQETLKPIVEVVSKYVQQHQQLANTVTNTIILDEVDKVTSRL